ncbi:MAG: Spx/MgsR family RNA polymerase-binding regulatory protein [Burkholderiaceae bacterium]|nr:Spx/MgsR family RNA polymerase-binding regulatory protein [Burkholderiaceae bacterium]
MSQIQLYGLKNCSTCVKALKWLTARDITCQLTDYRSHPIAPQTLQTWADQLGGFDKLVNRASTSWRGLSDDQKSASTPEHWLALIAEFPTLIKRPVLVLADGQINLGFSEKKYDELFA